MVYEVDEVDIQPLNKSKIASLLSGCISTSSTL